LRRTVLAVAVVLTLLGCLIAAFHRPLLRRFLLPEVRQKLAESLGIPVEIDDIVVELSGRVTVVGVHASGESPVAALEFLEAERVEVDLSFGEILSGGEDVVASIRVIKPRLRFDLDRSPLLPETEDDGEAPQLPLVFVEEGECRFELGDEHVVLEDIDAVFDGPRLRIHLDVASARGNWSLPRLDRLHFPLEATVSLAEGDQPFVKLMLETVRTDGDVLAEDFVLDFREDGVIRLGGRLPKLGLASISAVISDTSVDIETHAWGAPLANVVQLFVDADTIPVVDVYGDVSLSLPLPDVAAWQAHADVVLYRASWSERGLRADRIELEATRADGRLEVRGYAEALRQGELAPLDLAFDIEQSIDDAGALRVEVRESFVELAGSRIALSGVVTADDAMGPVIRDGRLLVSEVPIADLLPLLPVDAARLPTGDGTLDVTVALDGPLDFESIHATVDANLSFEPVDGLPVGFELKASLDNCDVEIIDGYARRGFDWMRFAASISDPASPHIEVRRLEGLLEGRRLATRGRPRFTSDGERFEIDGLELDILDGTLALRAKGTATSIDELTVEAVGLLIRPETLDDVLPREWMDSESLDFSGRLDGTMSGSCRFENGEVLDPLFAIDVDVSDIYVWDDGEFHDDAELTLSALVDETTLTVTRIEVRDANVRVEGAGDIDLRWAPLPTFDRVAFVDASVVASITDVGALPFLETSEMAMSGAAGGTLCIGGVLDDPEVFARATLVRGSVKASASVPRVTEIQGDVVWSDRRIGIERLEGIIDRRRFEVEGGLNLRALTDVDGPLIQDVDIRLRAKQVLLLRQPDLRVRGDLDLRWHGPWKRSTLTGTIDLGRSYYRRDIELSVGGRSLPLDLFHIETAPLSDMRLDVRVRSEAGIALINNVVRTQAIVNLHLGGTGRDPLLTGTLSTDQGDVILAASQLELRSAIVEFTEKDPYNPLLQMLFEDEVKGYRIRVTIAGTLEEPQIILDSTPPLPSEQLLVLLTTGYTVAEIGEQGGGRVAAVQLATYLGRRLAGYFARGEPVGDGVLSRVKLETRSARRAYLKDLVGVEYLVKKGAIVDGDEVFLQTERDTYGQYNFNFGIRFSVK
jgi:hypothetical protein